MSALIIVFLIAIADYITGHEMSLAVFYLLPIWGATFPCA
jgi:hypothetical protein